MIDEPRDVDAAGASAFDTPTDELFARIWSGTPRPRAANDNLLIIAFVEFSIQDIDP